MARRRVPRIVYKRYILSHIGIALFICMLVGLAFLFFLTAELRENTDTEYALRMSGAVTEMCNLIASMEDMSLKTKTTRWYLPAFIRKSTLNEVALIEDMEKFKDYLPIECQHYIFYPELDTVYSMSARYSFDIFSRYIMKMDIGDGGAFRGALADTPQGLAPSLVGLGDSLIFIFPDAIRGTQVRSLFVIGKDVLARRLAFIAGVKNDEIALFHGDLPMLGAGGGAGDVISADVPGSGLRLAVSVNNQYERLQTILMSATALLVGIAALAVSLSVYLARRNYRPIDEIMHKFASDGAGSTDELAVIDQMLSKAIGDSHHFEKRLRGMALLISEQSMNLRQRLIELLLNGKHDEEMLRDLDAVGVKLPYKFFALTRITFDQPFDYEKLDVLITGLSDQDTLFYTSKTPSDNGIVILINMSTRSNLPYVLAMLGGLDPDIEPAERLRIEGVCDDIGDLPGLMANLAAERNARPAFERSLVDELMQEIEAGNLSDALTLLSEIGNNVELHYRDNRMKENAYIDVLRALNTAAAKLYLPAVSLPGDKPLLGSQSFVSFAQPFVRSLVGTASRAGEKREYIAEEILRYIDDHLIDYELTLDHLSAVFGISTRHIGRVIKSKTGLGYKEWLINQRIEHAKYCLGVRKMSVGEVGALVGYSNISYFIKVFKETVGMTPAAYKISRSADEEEGAV